MIKYLLFIVVFLFSFIINITVTKGETGKNIKADDWDVYYKKTNIFRSWYKKESGISDMKKNLLSLPPEKIVRKIEIKKKAAIEVSEKPESKLLKNLIQGTVKLVTPKSAKEMLQTSDVFLEFIMKPAKQTKEESLKPELKKRVLIFGNSFERNCYWDKKGCGFPMDIQVRQYSQKLTPQQKQIDTSRFPVDF